MVSRRSAVREPRFWHDEAFNNPSQPVVGVCWYEAMAYARWLAAVTGSPTVCPPSRNGSGRPGAAGGSIPGASSWDAGQAQQPGR